MADRIRQILKSSPAERAARLQAVKGPSLHDKYKHDEGDYNIWYHKKSGQNREQQRRYEGGVGHRAPAATAQ